MPAGLEDPVYGKDAGFYLFTLPLLDGVYGLLMLLGILAGVIALLRLWRAMAAGDGGFKSGRLLPIDHRPLYVAAGFLLLVFAFGNYLNRFHLMYSQLGVVYGPGWTDIHIRLPVYWILIVLCVVTGAAFLIPALRDRIHRVARRPWKRLGPADALAVLTPILAIVAVAVVGVMLVPGLAQWLKVQPSEITLERPYLQDNIRFTRVGFRLHEIEDRQFPVV